MRYLAFVTVVVMAGNDGHALDYLKVKQDGQTVHLTGKILVEAEDGGVLLRDRLGALWDVQPEQILSRDSDARPFKQLQSADLQAALIKELPSGFKIHKTAHYVVCYNTSPAYAQWCGALYERLHRAFYSYWKQRGLELRPTEHPMVAIVFDGRASYEVFAEKDLGADPGGIIGYYSLKSNRVIMYDLTGADGLQQGRVRVSNSRHVNRILSQPRAERTVATIIHEATHQLAFNCGLQTRYGDNPLWLSEGLAIYFETPDLKSAKGWRRIGAVNRVRLAEFQKNLGQRSADSLLTLIADDKRFRSTDLTVRSGAYAEAWALNYFLIRRFRRQYVEYLKVLAQKKPLVEDGPDQRLAEFKKAFGEDLASLDAQFVRHLRRVR